MALIFLLAKGKGYQLHRKQTWSSEHRGPIDKPEWLWEPYGIMALCVCHAAWQSCGYAVWLHFQVRAVSLYVTVVKEELEKARWNSHCHNSHIFLFKCCFKAQTLKENNDKILVFSKLASVLICYRRKSKKCWRPKTAAAELHFVSVNISWSHALQLARFESPGGFFLRSLPDLQHLNKHAGTHSFIAFLQFLLL